MLSVSRPTSARSAASAWEGEQKQNGGARGGACQDPEIAPADRGPQPASCWTAITSSVRGMWATRMTEETNTDRELYVRTTLRELVIYVIFLLVLSILTFGMTSSSMFYYTKVMSDLFLDGSFEDTKNTFRGMTHPHDFWRFVEGPLVDGLYWEKHYNGGNVTEHGYIYFENKVLGVPRVRQLKVRNDSCTVHDDFKDDIKFCYDSYSPAVEEKARLDGSDNGTAYTYHTEDELDGSGHWGLLATYRGGGYYQDLGVNKNETLTIFEQLKSDLWIDRGTRVVFFDFTVYNANINLFCVIKLLVEFPATGGVIPSWSFRTVKLIRYVSVSDYFVLACELIFAMFIFYYAIEETIEIKKHKLKYFKSFWNILDIVVISIAMLCIVFSVYRFQAVDAQLTQLLAEKDTYADFEFLGFWQTQFNNAVAVAVFFAWIKTFKYISFNKTMTQLSSTLSRCAKDIGGFAIMFCIIFFAFAQLGYLIFGTQVKDFSTFGNATFTLLRIILGDFDFHELEQANRVLGPIYFCSYVFFVFFVLLNMFLAIINDTYSEVKSEIALTKNEFEISDYFKKGYQKMLGKISSKRDRIVDIQKALERADLNDDNILDFDEWRTELQKRGYADAEIETVFAKYDLDGDRVLDQDEQRKMMADLEGQKDELNQELANAENNKSDSQLSGAAGTGASAKSKSNFQDTDSDDVLAPPANAVTFEEFDVVRRRVDRMEQSVSVMASKLDSVIASLQELQNKRGPGSANACTAGSSSKYLGGNVDKMQMSGGEEPEKHGGGGGKLGGGGKDGESIKQGVAGGGSSVSTTASLSTSSSSFTIRK